MRPVIEYGSSVLDPVSLGLNEKLEIMQKRATRFCNEKLQCDGWHLGELKWEPFQKMCKDKSLILLYKRLKGRVRILTYNLYQIIGIAETNTL